MRTKSPQYLKRQISAKCAQWIWETLCVGWESNSKDLHRQQQIGQFFTPPTLDRKEKAIRSLEGVTDVFKVKVTDLIYFCCILSTFSSRSRYCKSQLETFRCRYGALFWERSEQAAAPLPERSLDKKMFLDFEQNIFTGTQKIVLTGKFSVFQVF